MSIEKGGSMQVSIVYDYLCPFCYRQHLVLKDFENLEVKPLPYMLKADVALDGEKMEGEDLEKKKAAGEDLEKKPECQGVILTGRSHYYNTYLAHQLSLGAYKKGKYLPFALAVYQAYFEEDQNIGDIRALEGLCKKLDLDIQDLLASVGAEDMRKALHAGYSLKTDHNLKTVPILYFPDQEKIVDHSTSKEELEDIVRKL